MDFPSKEVTYYKIWSSDFEDFVKDRFNTTYRYAETMDFPSQDTYYEYTIGNESCGDRYRWDEEACIEKEFDEAAFLMDMYSTPLSEKPSPDDILEYLYVMGEIPAGEYLFTIWW